MPGASPPEVSTPILLTFLLIPKKLAVLVFQLAKSLRNSP
jgi:hypothetical protein